MCSLCNANTDIKSGQSGLGGGGQDGISEKTEKKLQISFPDAGKAHGPFLPPKILLTSFQKHPIYEKKTTHINWTHTDIALYIYRLMYHTYAVLLPPVHPVPDISSNNR